MATFVLIPYDGDYPSVSVDIEAGDNLDSKLKSAIRGRFEEYEIEITDGTSEEIDIWSNIRDHHYSGLRKFLDIFENHEDLLPGIAFAFYNYPDQSVEDAALYAENGMVREGDLESLAEEFVDEGIVDTKNYFDYERFARDCEINGELPEEAYDEDGEQIWDSEEVLEWAESLVDDIGVENIQGDYTDYEAIARDLAHDYAEFEFAGTEYTILTSQ